MAQALHGSLKRLGTDHVDLYWMHAWDEMTPVEEVMRAFDDFVRAGKVLYIGISDAPAWWVARANTLAELRGWTQFVGLQIEYNLIERTPETRTVADGRSAGPNFTVTPRWSPLASGWLTGKYAAKSKEEKRLDKTPQFARRTARNEAIAKTVVKVAKAAGKSPAQVALNWLRARRNTIPIIGARKLSQLEDNLDCVKWSLNAKQLAQLTRSAGLNLVFRRTFCIVRSCAIFFTAACLIASNAKHPGENHRRPVPQLRSRTRHRRGRDVEERHGSQVERV